MNGQSEPEGSALSWTALDPYLPILTMDELLADVETQAQTSLPSILDRSMRALVKAFPDMDLLLWRETRTAIAHPDPYSSLLQIYANLDGLTGRCKFESIG